MTSATTPVSTQSEPELVGQTVVVIGSPSYNDVRAKADRILARLSDGHGSKRAGYLPLAGGRCPRLGVASTNSRNRSRNVP
jgi:hypothetical protein